MLTILVHFRIRKTGTALRLLFPVILIWIILAACFSSSSLRSAGAALTWRRGPGRLLLLVYR